LTERHGSAFITVGGSASDNGGSGHGRIDARLVSKVRTYVLPKEVSPYRTIFPRVKKNLTYKDLFADAQLECCAYFRPRPDPVIVGCCNQRIEKNWADGLC